MALNRQRAEAGPSSPELFFFKAGPNWSGCFFEAGPNWPGLFFEAGPNWSGSKTGPNRSGPNSSWPNWATIRGGLVEKLREDQI